MVTTTTGRSAHLYSRTAAAWALVFGIAGLLFALVPTQIGVDLSNLAALLGLGGSVDSGGRDLWWALSVSLMATITLLAGWSAKEPYNAAPYAALLTSKLGSTAAFVLLAVAQGPAWLLPAAADSGVAATLWLARRTLGPLPRAAAS